MMKKTIKTVINVLNTDVRELSAQVVNRIQPNHQPTSQRIWINRAPAGEVVTNDTALKHTAVWRAINLLAQTMGSLSIKMFDQMPNGTKQIVTSGRLYNIFNMAPNPFMTTQTFFETLVAHWAGWGRAYAEIERDSFGRAVNLWIITPDRVTPEWRDDGNLWYQIENNGSEAVYIPARNMLHIHGVGFDGVEGYDPIAYNSQSISQGLAIEQHTSDFFRNGAHLLGALFSQKTLDKDARKNIRESWNESYGGSGKSYRMAVFGEDMKYEQLSISPENSQLLESRKFKVTDIARIWGIPAHLLNDLQQSTFNNIEQQGIEFVQFTILPLAVRFEQEIKLKLFPTNSRKIKFNLNSLMRGDMKSRNEAYKIGREWGWLNADEIRELEDMNPIGGIEGESYIVPLNYQLASDLGMTQEPEQESTGIALVNDISKRIAARTANAFKNVDIYKNNDCEYIDKWLSRTSWVEMQLAVLEDYLENKNIVINAGVLAKTINETIKNHVVNDGEISTAAIKNVVSQELKFNILGA